MIARCILVAIRDGRLMLLAGVQVLSRALEREDMPAVHGTQTREGHTASGFRQVRRAERLAASGLVWYHLNTLSLG
jgi:hypothetical protein